MSAVEQAAKWARMPMMALDFETTGIDPFEARTVTAALVVVEPEKRPRIQTYVVDPGIDIPEEATAVHGYTRERAAAEATHTVDQALFEIVGRVALWLEHGKPLVVFNAPYDVTLLEAECRRHQVEGLIVRRGHTAKITPVIDPMVLDKAVDPYRKGICAEDRKNPCSCGAVDKKLTSLCLHYGVQHVGAHDAAGDALAACRLWPRIIARHPEKFRGFTLAALHQAQIGWRRQQQVSLAQYFARQGDHEASASCSTEWPIQSPPRPVETADVQGALL